LTTHQVTRAAADIGGTFTDIAVLGPDGRIATRKVPSTPHNYADAVVAGIRGLLEELGAPSDGIQEVIHGCTVATNAILEGKGATTALLTTQGFRDVLELRRVRVPRLYEPLYERPPPLVPRQLRFEISERVDARGETIVPLDEAAVRRVAERIRALGIEAVAVCFLHSYANAEHERRTGEILRESLPEAFISTSVDVLPQKLEYERTSTTVINAYVGPPVERYIRSLMDQLSKAGLGSRLMVMQSSGGILDAEAVTQMPARIVECGPAAGVIAAKRFGSAAGFDNMITLDMGGTTAKASLVEKGNISYADEYEVGGGMSTRSALMGGGGYALKLPVIDISEVGAGGGSIAWLDKAGTLKVGPQSAGAVPGPVCYGAGNEAPTVTDANVVLGYLNPTALAGGTVPIDAEKALDAIAQRIAGPLKRDVMETAYGIHTVANANMMRAVKAVTTYRGRDPRDFTLVAFGGSGGVHAVQLAKVLQIPRVVLPVAAGVFSALGLLFSDLEMNETAPFQHLAMTAPLAQAEQSYRRLADRIASVLGGQRDDIQFHQLVDVRFSGQAYELTVSMGDTLDEASLIGMCQRFEAEHLARYGHAFSGEFPVEIVNLRLVGSRVPDGIVDPVFDPAAVRGGETTRSCYFGPEIGMHDAAVIGRGRLDGTPKSGPFIIEEYEGTAVIPPDCRAHLDSLGNVIIDIGLG
jgi:N-methylhydantoinase A